MIGLLKVIARHSANIGAKTWYFTGYLVLKDASSLKTVCVCPSQLSRQNQRDLAKKDSSLFLETYGFHYVQSLLHICTWWILFWSSWFDYNISCWYERLEMEAYFPYRKSIFTPEGSAEFVDCQRNSNSNLQVRSKKSPATAANQIFEVGLLKSRMT
jgi:hypothetical protein